MFFKIMKLFSLISCESLNKGISTFSEPRLSTYEAFFLEFSFIRPVRRSLNSFRPIVVFLDLVLGVIVTKMSFLWDCYVCRLIAKLNLAKVFKTLFSVEVKIFCSGTFFRSILKSWILVGSLPCEFFIKNLFTSWLIIYSWICYDRLAIVERVRVFHLC